MTTQEAINKIIKWAEAQVGYKAGSDKHTKYADLLDGLGDFYNGPKQWKGGAADWCEIFIDAGFVSCFGSETGRKMLYQPKKSTGAGCGFSAQFYRDNGAWTKTPQLGAQIYYGRQGNEQHTGLVVGIEGKYIWTVEGNTGGGNGQVMKKKVLKTANIAGYGIPKWSLVSATPKFTQQKGIDISEWQYDYDMYQAKKQGIKFVIIRGGGGDGSHGSGIYKDIRFEQNYEKAKSLGIPVGVYWFFNAKTEARAKEEAEFFFNNCLKGKQFELPIYLDVEQGVLKQSARSLTNNILYFLKYIRNKGFWVGVYSSTSAFADKMYDTELKSYCHWIADWRKKCYYPNYYGMWQFTDGEGLPTIGGRKVDQDIMYEDYEKEIKAKGLNGWGSKPTPTPKPKLDEDGIFGHNSTIALQKWRGTYQDGVISGQLKSAAQYYPALISCSYIGSAGSPCIASWQRYLIAQGFSCGKAGADGIIGKDTTAAIQKWLIKQGYKLKDTKKFDADTAKAMQNFLNKTVYK